MVWCYGYSNVLSDLLGASWNCLTPIHSTIARGLCCSCYSLAEFLAILGRWILGLALVLPTPAVTSASLGASSLVTASASTSTLAPTTASALVTIVASGVLPTPVLCRPSRLAVTRLVAVIVLEAYGALLLLFDGLVEVPGAEGARVGEQARVLPDHVGHGVPRD